MNHPAAELQKAIYGALNANAALIVALSGSKIFDHHPEKVAFPYLVLGRATNTDWSTSSEEGIEHLITIHSWSKKTGRSETWQLQQLIKSSLHDVDLLAQDHFIINLRLEFSEARRDAASGRMHGIMRFRAVTEPKI